MRTFALPISVITSRRASKNSLLTGTKTDETRQAKPNEEVEVTVSEYEPLSVEVKTTSVVDGTDRVIKIKQDNIYPGE